MKNKVNLQGSVREFDADGRLKVQKSNISKECVNPYYGSEIPGYKNLGLDPNKIYYLYRPGEELKKAADSFNGIQILDKHEAISSDEPKKDLVIGALGTNAKYEAPYLTNSLFFWDKDAIALIEAADSGRGGAKELSCGYSFVPDMTPGTFNGEHYDGVMREIVGNHVALVESGRAGSDVKVSDYNIFIKNGVETVKKPSKAQLIMDKAKELKLDIKESDANELIKSVLALDEKEDAAQDKKHAKDKKKAKDEDDLQNIDDPEPSKPAFDKDDDETDKETQKIIDMLKAKKLDDEEIEKIIRSLKRDDKTGDEDKDEKEDVKKDDRDEKEVKKAMDSLEKKIRQSFLELDAAKDDVRELVGDVKNVSKAEEVYRFALEQNGVSSRGINELSALKKMCELLKGARSNRYSYEATKAMDSSDLLSSCKNISRIKI